MNHIVGLSGARRGASIGRVGRLRHDGRHTETVTRANPATGTATPGGRQKVGAVLRETRPWVF